MGAPKQKWTQEEEAALRAGVEKHGLGKWRAIQKDPEFAYCLATRSNVDLKDKWRNLNGGVVAHGSRETSKRVSKHTLARAMDDCTSLPSASTSEDLSIEDTDSAADALTSTENLKGKKSLGARLAGLITDAISELNDFDNCNINTITSFIEAHHLVPGNFRSMVKSKLRDMVGQGKLVKAKQNYGLNSGNEELPVNAGKRMRGMLKSYDMDSPTSRAYGKEIKGDFSAKRAKLEFGFAKSKMKTPAEAARAAALLVAEAEAAAIAAEKAASEAEAAEVEAEAAEIAAEIAFVTSIPSRKGKSR